jgi:hypothetical protein
MLANTTHSTKILAVNRKQLSNDIILKIATLYHKQSGWQLWHSQLDLQLEQVEQGENSSIS